MLGLKDNLFQPKAGPQGLSWRALSPRPGGYDWLRIMGMLPGARNNARLTALAQIISQLSPAGQAGGREVGIPSGEFSARRRRRGRVSGLGQNQTRAQGLFGETQIFPPFGGT